MLPAPMDEHPTAAILPRPRLIVPANNSITIFPPTTPHNPLLNPVNPVNPVQNFYTLNTIYTAIIFSFRVFRGSNLCVLCVLLDHHSLGEDGCGFALNFQQKLKSLNMLFHPPEVDIQLMERREECAHRRPLRHLSKRVHILREALAAVAELAVGPWDVSVRIIDVARE